MPLAFPEKTASRNPTEGSVIVVISIASRRLTTSRLASQLFASDLMRETEPFRSPHNCLEEPLLISYPAIEVRKSKSPLDDFKRCFVEKRVSRVFGAGPILKLVAARTHTLLNVQLCFAWPEQNQKECFHLLTIGVFTHAKERLGSCSRLLGKLSKSSQVITWKRRLKIRSSKRECALNPFE